MTSSPAPIGSPASPVRMLVVEDESLVALDLETRLTRFGYDVSGVVDNGEDALEHLRQNPVDLVLMDIHIRGDKDGVETAGIIRRTLSLPVVFLTAHADDATLQRAGLAEPFGYVLKPFDERELRAAIQIALYRNRAEQRLHKMERWLSTTLRSIGDGVIATDIEGRITFINAMGEAISGWTRGAALGRPLQEVFVVETEKGGKQTATLFQEAMADGLTITLGEGRSLVTRDGLRVPVNDSIAPIRDDNGDITGCVVIFRDHTAQLEAEKRRRELETKMQEAQRLESLGVLAGGIAHDFNNLLAIVSCNASLGLTTLPDDSPVVPCLKDIEQAVQRAALLCRQMLAYAGKGQIARQEVELSKFTRETADLLRVAIHKTTDLKLELTEGLPPVRADRSQLQQVIMNLVINGSEALNGQPGRITVRTQLFPASRAFLDACRQGTELPAADYVLLEVADTGHGMTPEVLSRIFDPFFTTKFTGRGLGLAALSGIVRSHGGALSVDSTPGVGTTFRVLFPPVLAPTLPPESKPSNNALWTGSGRALVVDDEVAVRLSTAAVLRRLGFEVDTAENGHEAMARALDPESNYRFVLLDLTMPVMSGHAAFQGIRAHLPNLPVLLMSGYSNSEATALFQTSGPVDFVQKPFMVADLIAKLQPLLAG